ncbi:TKL family protein kinase [Histomonas meleagridis]|uniref:TKL family protein kinase n=1 Tax=Histomonas meleagridis TaxID=135588 RepID=UPI00355AA6A6|nr:TKL family protein kinase [Histomonas meleagridis]KAH0803473.1 TKL family protein kinase [Histomonas meleagridis]
MRRNKFLEKPPNAKHLMKMVPSEEILIPSNSSMEISEPVPPRPTKFLDKEDSLLDLSLIEIPKSPPTQSPQWVLNILSRISNLLSNQASITIHRSKLFSLFDDFRSLSRNFFPNTLLDSSILGPACHLFVETLEKARQLVYNCSASHWSQSAIMWHTNYACTSIRRIREDTNECLISLQCQNAPNFIKSDEELKAQNNVDLLRLKGTLMNYLTRVDEQENKTPKMEQIEQLIKERIRSIGPIEGLYDGPAVVSIPPFLPSKLNLVLKHEDFELGKIIGSGTFGCVYRGILKSTNQKVAIKVLNTNSLGGRQLETFKREVWTMANLNHPSILRLLGVTLTAPFCIVTELLKCSLFDKMKYLSATKKSIIACKVSQAMEQLHSARIIHRDLKSANILLDDDDLPRVCDFGLVGFKTGGTKTGFIGTAQWMAPEILRSSPFYDEKVDVYSFGILLWELLTLSVPYNGMTQDQMVMSIIEHGARPEIPLNAGPPKLINLMKRCWSEDPIERPSFQQISIILYSPDVHFIGTNEIEFSEKTPHESLSSSIISAFDTCNWKLLDELILEITPEKFDEDNELIDTIVSLFPNFDSERQANIILHLPQMVDLQSFLCLKGYQFIVSLFSYTSIVIEAIVNTLKTLDLSSKGFRQVKLLNTIAHSKNEAALELCIDLCQFFDIAKYITENDLPIPYEGLCHGLASNMFIQCPDGNYLCQICSKKSKLLLGPNMVSESPQFKENVYDINFPDSPQREANFKGVQLESKLHLLVIEKTQATCDNNLFMNTLTNFSQKIDKIEDGFVSVFTFDETLTVPLVKETSFSLQSYCDLDGAILPDAKKLFFDLSRQKELFFSYINLLLRLQPRKPSLNVFNVVLTVSTFSSKLGISSLIVTSLNPIGTSDKYRELGLQSLKISSPLNICCVTPLQYQPDYTPLSELSLISNAHVSIYTQDQLDTLPNIFVDTLFRPKYSNTFIYAVVPPQFKIVDIKGPGLRRSDKSFVIPSIQEDDTIYFYLDYDVSRLDMTSPSVQFQFRYYDGYHQRIARIMSFNFSLSDNMHATSINCDYDVFISSAIISSIDKARETDDPQSALTELNNLRNNFFNDNFAKLFLYNQPSFILEKVLKSFNNAVKLLTSDNFSYLMGNSPYNISLFFVPIAYTFNLNSVEMKGPFTLPSVGLQTGAIYVKLSSERAAILLAKDENVQQWAEAVNAPPVSELIAQVCQERVIEILSPLTSAKHPMYQHIMKCMLP